MDDAKTPPLVLCVDDDPPVAALVARAVSTLGVTTQIAADGEDGFQMWRRFRDAVRLVLTDHQMPRCSGLRFVARLRSEGYAGPVIVHSSSLSEADRAEYQRWQVDAIVDKPSSFADLTETVRAVLARH